MLFNVGTTVIVTNGTHYRYTKTGSQGIIIDISGDESEYLIEFSYLTGIQLSSDETNKFWIDVGCVDMIEDTDKGPYAKINMKVKQMYRRRKEEGYAF